MIVKEPDRAVLLSSSLSLKFPPACHAKNVKREEGENKAKQANKDMLL